jgi:predicted kinase
MMRQPTLFLTVGLPCTGKTTAARRIEIEQEALRLTKDEWVKALYGHENPPSAQDVIEGRLIQIGLRALELGNNVVIDYGLWGRDERSALRQAAADLGAMVEMRYFELTPAEQRSAKPKRHTRLGLCPTRNSPSGLPASTSQRQANSTAVNPLMTHRLDSRHGTSGADTAGRRRSPDACSSQRCHDRSSAMPDVPGCGVVGRCGLGQVPEAM